MKKLILLLVLLSTAFSIAQTKLFENLPNYKETKFITMMDENNSVKGYFVFYEGERLKKNQQEYLLEILDPDLNSVLVKKYIDSKFLLLKDAKFNQKELMVWFQNYKSFEYKLVSFDLEGNVNKTYEITRDKKKDLLAEIQAGKSMGESSNLYSIDNQGFLFVRCIKGIKTGYKLQFFSSNDKSNWTYGTPDKKSKIEFFNAVEVCSRGISYFVFSKKSYMSKKLQIIHKVLDLEGKLIVNENLSTAAVPKTITNTYFEDNKFVNIGEYFLKGDNPIKDTSKGVVFDVYDYDGNLLSSKKTSWDNDLLGKFKVSKEKKVRNHLFFHEFLKTNDGGYIAVAEEHMTKVNGGKVALSYLSGGILSVDDISIKDANFLKFNNEFDLMERKTFEKGNTKGSSSVIFGSSQMNALNLSYRGGFDYEYSQVNPDKDRIYSLFVYEEEVKQAKDKIVLKAVIYNKGNYSEDKIYFDKKNEKSIVLPAKSGYVLIFTEDEEEKSYTLHLEKLNL